MREPDQRDQKSKCRGRLRSLPSQQGNSWAMGFPFIFSHGSAESPHNTQSPFMMAHYICLVLLPFSMVCTHQAAPVPLQLALRAWCHALQSQQEAPCIAAALEFCSKKISQPLKFVSYTGSSAEEKWLPPVQSKATQLHREEPVCFC